MSRIITTTVYTLDELSCPARKKPATGTVSIMLTATGMKTCMKTSGRSVTFSGLTSASAFSGSATAGLWKSRASGSADSAAVGRSLFEGRWHWQPATVRRIRKYAPQEHELHRIADALQAVQKRNFWQLQAEISHRGRYCHPYSMDITVTRNSPTGQAMTADAEAAVSEVLRDLAFWLYRQLENEYDWLTSDAAVDEALLINEYTFTEAGLRAG